MFRRIYRLFKEKLKKRPYLKCKAFSLRIERVIRCGFKEFLKDRAITIGLLIFAIITIEIFLMIYPVGSFIKIYIPIIIAVMYTIRNPSRIFC